MKIKGNLIVADEGKILTDGGVYSPIFDLGTGKTIDDFYEITKEEYEAKFNQEAKEEEEEECLRSVEE